MLIVCADIALALGALVSFLLLGTASLRRVRPTMEGLELFAYGAGLGVLIHGLAGVAVALSPAKQITAWGFFLLLWCAAIVSLWRDRSRVGAVSGGSLFGWREPGVRPTLVLLVGFIVFCVSVTHLWVPFPRTMPDGPYVFKQHSLATKIQVLTGDLPVDNYLPFVVEEFLLRDISFTREHPIIPGQEVTNRPILMALVIAPFRAALSPPPRLQGPLGTFNYVAGVFPDVGKFMAGPGYREFLAIAIALNALVLVGAALLIVAHGPRFLLVPALLLLATSPFYLSQTIFSWPKSLAGFYLLLAVHAMLRGKPSAWVAILGVLAYDSHPYAAVFLGSFGCRYLVDGLVHRRRGELIALLSYGVTALFALAPWFIWTHLVVRLPSNLVAQSLVLPGMDTPMAHLWSRAVNLNQILDAAMLRVYPFQAGEVFRAAIGCLPGIIGLLVLPAYLGCIICLRSHRLLVVYATLLPTFLLLLPFSGEAELTLMGCHAIAIFLLLIGLIMIARAGRVFALTFMTVQILLQMGLAYSYGQALGISLSPTGVIYQLLYHHPPEVRGVPHAVNFHVDIAIGNDHADSIWMNPPTSLVYRHIRLPAGVIHFRTRIAIHPLVWADPAGDGAEFILEVRPSGAPDSSESHPLCSVFLNPAHHSEQRVWVPMEVDLSPFAGQTIDLILKNGPGSANNDYGDWCIWADPAVIRL